jgi:DNA-binding CsgD family transcriptional regulator
MDRNQVRALVGRARELAEIDAALGRVAGGEPWLIQIVGEPGIGKSSMLAALRRHAEDRGYLALDGRAAEFEQDIPFGLIIDALSDYLASLEPATLRVFDDDILRELASIFPSLPAVERVDASGPGGAERYRLHYAIRRVLERLTERRPMVLALDDLHWADAASIEMLAHLLRRFRGPLLTAVAYRPTSGRLLAGLEATLRGGAVTRVQLAPLAAEDAAQLLDPSIDDATRRAVYRESGGNPFYIEQLARTAPSRRPRVSRGTGPSGESLPQAVIAAIDEELGAVSAPARLVLQAAAVAGESFEPELVGAIAEQTVPDVLTALDELLEVDLIRPSDVPRRFSFRHPIVRRAVYDGMPRGWRLGAHARAAVALTAARAPVGVRAHHVEQSATTGDGQAIDLLVQAGRDAAPRAPQTAGRWLLAATRLLSDGEGSERRVSLLTEAATALIYAGAYDDGLAALETALTLLAPERVDDRAGLVARIAFGKRMSGHPLESRVLVERTLESLPLDSPGARALTLELALDHYWRGEFGPMHAVARAVAEQARSRGEHLHTAWGAALCSLASSALGQLEDGLAELGAARTACARLSEQELAQQLDVVGYVAQAAATLERADEALEHARRALRLARMSGQTPLIPGLLVLETNALFMKGRITDAVAVAETATDAAVLTAYDQFAVWALWADAMVCSAAGDTARALASARDAAVRSEALAETFFSSLSRLHLAAALNAAGDAAGARAELVEFETAPNQPLLDLRGGHGWELLVETQLALGDVDAAEESAAMAEARARATALPQRTVRAICGRAAVLLARGEATAALAAAREAAALSGDGANPLLAARAAALAGTALGRLGRITEALSELEQAERTFFGFGAHREASSAARELRRLGRRGPRRILSRGATRGIEALSAREREVAALVAAGKRNRDVAAALFVSEKTIESHLARIYDKLGVRSRAALATLLAGAEEAEPPALAARPPA